MFTGITEQVGKIESLERGPDGGRLVVAFGAGDTAKEIARGTKLGDSIAVNGCCLTVVEFDKSRFAADLSGETLRRTNLGEKKAGDLVNLERPLAAGARLGGHFMQGHVDGVGRVTRLVPEGDNFWLSVRVPEDLRRYVADIAVIPFTHAHTNVGKMIANDAVNLETDILAKYVESLLANTKTNAGETASSISVKELVEEGF
jgi:riboflavin synthase